MRIEASKIRFEDIDPQFSQWRKMLYPLTTLKHFEWFREDLEGFKKPRPATVSRSLANYYGRIFAYVCVNGPTLSELEQYRNLNTKRQRRRFCLSDYKCLIWYLDAVDLDEKWRGRFHTEVKPRAFWGIRKQSDINKVPINRLLSFFPSIQ